MKKSITQDIIERARVAYPKAVESAKAYLGPYGAPDPTKALISGDPTASELLARGYPQYVAEGVARSHLEGQS